MGPQSLKKIVTQAHQLDRGVIALCHMSAPEAKASYEINVKLSKNSKPKPLYHLFLKWAISNKADGIIVGATFPKIVNDCKKIAGKKLDTCTYCKTIIIRQYLGEIHLFLIVHF